MGKDELKNYFKTDKATYIDSPSLGGAFYSDEVDFRSDAIDFKILDNNEEFVIEYYDNTQAVINSYRLKSTGKLHVISMSEDSYKLAKAALSR